MKVKGITFFGFAAAILMGPVDASAYSIASQAYVDQQVASVSSTSSDAVDALAEKIGGDYTSENTVADAIGNAITTAEGYADDKIGALGENQTVATTYQTLANKTTDLSGTFNDDTQYPSAKAVKAAITAAQTAAETTAALDATTKANAAETAAKNYTDSQIGALGENQTVATTYQTLANKTTDLSGTFNDDTQYPSAKAVKAALEATGGDVSGVSSRVTALEGIVGDAEDGLVKDVADNADAISTINSSAAMTSGITSALVGKITANETAIGDANSGLTKAVADNTSAISTINSSAAMTSGITSALVGKITANETAIGDANSGLTKSVADLGTNKQDKLSIPASCGESGRCVLTSDTSGNLEWVDITSPLNAQQ